MRHFLLSTALILAAGTGDAQDRSMIVLDGSGSMWGQIDGVAKIQIARATLTDVLGAVPAESELGLMVYGHRRKGDCTDIELAVPAAVGTSAAITGFADAMKPKGKTPLSAAVQQAAEAMNYTEDKATVILVTDGLETCDADPCALGRALEEAGVNFTAHVVGFGLTGDEQAQVACLAEETGGQYFDAKDAEALKEALTQTVVVAAPGPEPEAIVQPEPEVLEINFAPMATLSEGGAVLDDPELYWALHAIEGGETREAETVSGYGARFETGAEVGAYELRVRYHDLVRRFPVTLSATELARPQVNLDAGYLTIYPRLEDGGEVSGEIHVEIHAGETLTGGYGEGTYVVPAGDVETVASYAGLEMRQPVSVAAGETVVQDIVVAVGSVMLSATYALDGETVEHGDLYFILTKPTANEDGTFEEVVGGYAGAPLSAAPGTYNVIARLGEAEAMAGPVDITAGDEGAFTMSLEAGTVTVVAAGAERIVIRTDAGQGAEGEDLRTGYDAEVVETLPTGQYRAHVDYADGRFPQDRAFAIKAGDRITLTIE